MILNIFTNKIVGEAKNSSELWQLLVDEGGLMPKDYDSPIISEISKRLNLPTNTKIINALKMINPDMDTFIGVFFQSAQPYVKMWSELLTLYERAFASQSKNNIRIKYNFDKSLNTYGIDFDIEFFRKVLKDIEVITAPFDLTNIKQTDFWELSELFIGSGGSYRSTGTGLKSSYKIFDEQCRLGRYPHEMPKLSTVKDERSLKLLKEVWSLVDILLNQLRERFGSYTNLCKSFSDNDESLRFGLSKTVLVHIEHDHWVPTCVSSIKKYLDQNNDDLISISDALDNILEKFRNKDLKRKTTTERFREYLQLPIWKYRHDLYSHWVCAAVVNALDDQAPVIHSFNDAIEFLFSGTHLATFDNFNPKIHLWTEFRTPLKKIVGKGRSSHVQPDIILRQDPLTANNNPMVIECKQYKKANNRSFGEAITDYANGHPKSIIILVDYGEVNQADVFKYVPVKLHERSLVISKLHPANDAVLHKFQGYIREGLKLDQLASSISNFESKLELKWGSKPLDLDLHLIIEPFRHHLSYMNHGSLEEEPFAYLENDDTNGNGHEVIIIKQWLAAKYKVEVINYSKDAPLGISSAEIKFDIDGIIYCYSCPADFKDDVWNVCTIDGYTMEIKEDY